METVKPARKIAKEYKGSWEEYSLKLGKSRDYLSVYKFNNPHIKTPQQAYAEVLKRLEDQEYTCNILNSLLTYLVEHRRLAEFQRHLNKLEPNKSLVSLRRTRVMVMIIRTNLIERKTLERYKMIIKEIHEWM